MNPDRWRRVNEAFLAVAPLKPDEREAHLAHLEGLDPDLRREVEQLLAGDDRAAGDAFLQDSPLARLRSGAASLVRSEPGSSELGDTATSGMSSSAVNIDAAAKLSIPDFDLIRKLDGGGFGDVWLARSRSGVFRAVKILPRTMLTDVEIGGLRTYETFAGRHPNLIDVRHVGETPEFVYYVMELADGYASAPTFEPADYVPRTLKSELRRRGMLPAAEAVTIARQILAGLGHLHAAGLLHRDIKPANVVFVGGAAKLADIGLLSRDDARRRAGMTPDYAPPDGVVDRGGDLYSLGRVLSEMLCGDMPARGRSTPRVISTSAAAAVAPFTGLLEQACAELPESRFQSAADFERELGNIVGSVRHEGGSADELSRGVRERRGRARRLMHWRNGSIAAVVVGFVAVAFLTPTPPTRGDVRMTVVPQGRSGDAELPVEDHFPLAPEERIRFRVTLDRPGYPVLAVIAPDGQVDVVYPAAGAEQPRVEVLDLPRDGAFWPLPNASGCLIVVLLVSDEPVRDLDGVKAQLRELPAPDIDPLTMIRAEDDRPTPIRSKKTERIRGSFDPGYTTRVKDGAIQTIRRRLEARFKFVLVLAVPQIAS